MNKEELRAEFIRLTNLETVEECIELIDIFLDHLWSVINVHHKDKVYSHANKDAKIINQMMFTKLTHLRKIVEGVGYTPKNGDRINKIIDPTIVASLTRNIFETVAIFNLIFINTKSDDEKAIIYDLWVISGLKYRQRFKANVSIPENLKILEEEQERINFLIMEIEDTELYNSLDDKNKEKIQNKIKFNDFKIRFEVNEVKQLAWQDMCDVMKLNKSIFDNIYTYLSFYSHPSYVSVFQFENMYDKEDEAFKKMTIANLRYCIYLMSVFIADYMVLFPQIKETFEKLSIEKQIALNEHNRMLRGDVFSINSAWQNLV